MLTKNNIFALSDGAKIRPAFWVFCLALVLLWGVSVMRAAFPALAFGAFCLAVYALGLFALGLFSISPLVILRAWGASFFSPSPLGSRSIYGGCSPVVLIFPRYFLIALILP